MLKTSIPLAAMVLLFLTAALVCAADPPVAKTPAAPKTDPTADLLDGGAGAGITFYREGAWGVARLTVVNRTTAPFRGVAATYFKDNANLQFATDVALPPMSQRTYLQPIRCPDDVGGDHKKVEDVSLLLNHDGAPGPKQLARRDGLLRVETERPALTIMSDSEDDSAVDTVIAMKLVVGRGKRSSYMRPENTPALVAGLDAADLMVLSANEPELDSAQIETIRQWVLGGGRLWIMLDQVNPDMVRRILREDWTIQVVDHVPLTRVAFDNSDDTKPQDFEEPVDLARVIATGFEVKHRVNGWPASMQKKIGQGTVIVTTLGPRGWVDGWAYALRPLEELGGWFFVDRAPPPIPPAVFEGYLKSQIGHKVTSRTPVMIAMIVLVFGLLGFGMFLSRRGRLELLGPIGAVAAVAVAGLFIALGASNRGLTPLTVASAEFLRVQPTQQEATVNGLLSVYSPIEGQGPIEAQRGGVVWPDVEGQKGELLSMHWTDIDKWQWRGLKLPSGAVRKTDILDVVPLPSPARVEATFGPDGLTGLVVPGPFEDLQMPIVATPNGKLRARISAENALAAGPQDYLPGSDFTIGGVVDSGSSLRADVYRQLMPEQNSDALDKPVAESRRAVRYPAAPVFLAWAKTMNIGIALVQHTEEHRESALVEIPIDFTRPAPGTAFKIPSAFMPFRMLTRSGRAGNMIYDEQGRWIPISNAGNAIFAFKAPAVVSPCRVTGARIALNIHAPGRTVEMLGGSGEKDVSLGQHKSPIGEVVFESKDGEGLQPQADGTIVVVLKVGDASGADDQALWVVKDMRMDLSGQTESAK